MEIEVEITRKDFQEFNRYALKKNKGLKIFYLLLLMFLSLNLLLPGVKKSLDISYIVAVIISVFIIYFVLLFIFKQITALIARYTPSKRGCILGLHKFRISKEGLWESTEHTESLCKWKGIKSIDTTEKYIFVFVDSNMGHVIPKRYFKSELESENFIYTLRNKLEGITKYDELMDEIK
ncbi:MAG: YcxB family protein [Planctomycetota bacterium]|jgi:uncharacterized membrane protein